MPLPRSCSRGIRGTLPLSGASGFVFYGGDPGTCPGACPNRRFSRRWRCRKMDLTTQADARPAPGMNRSGRRGRKVSRSVTLVPAPSSLERCARVATSSSLRGTNAPGNGSPAPVRRVRGRRSRPGGGPGTGSSYDRPVRSERRCPRSSSSAPRGIVILSQGPSSSFTPSNVVIRCHTSPAGAATTELCTTVSIAGKSKGTNPAAVSDLRSYTEVMAVSPLFWMTNALNLLDALHHSGPDPQGDRRRGQPGRHLDRVAREVRARARGQSRPRSSSPARSRRSLRRALCGRLLFRSGSFRPGLIVGLRD